MQLIPRSFSWAITPRRCHVTYMKTETNTRGVQDWNISLRRYKKEFYGGTEHKKAEAEWYHVAIMDVT